VLYCTFIEEKVLFAYSWMII